MPSNHGVQLSNHWAERGTLNIPLSNLLIYRDWTTLRLSKPHKDWKIIKPTDPEYENSDACPPLYDETPIAVQARLCVRLQAYFRNSPPANNHNLDPPWFDDNQILLGVGGLLSESDQCVDCHKPTPDQVKAMDIFVETLKACLQQRVYIVLAATISVALCTHQHDCVTLCMQQQHL